MTFQDVAKTKANLNRITSHVGFQNDTQYSSVKHVSITHCICIYVCRSDLINVRFFPKQRIINVFRSWQIFLAVKKWEMLL